MTGRTIAKIRASELAKIHIAKEQLGLSEDDYRAAVMNASKGKTDSAGELDAQGRTALLAHFKRAGFKPRKPAAKPRQPAKPDLPIGDDREQVKKIRSLWIELHEFGAVRNSSEAGLAAYVKRIKGKEHPKFLDIDEASDVIEQLKKWLDRTRTAPFIKLLNLPKRMPARVVYDMVRNATQIYVANGSKDEWLRAQELLKPTGGHDG